MNKSERLNDLMLFLNDKNSFNLKDLMERYTISKSTALRDVRSLEEMGMPLFSQSGRNGYFGLLQNRLLSPIVFDTDEVFALYFSMITLRAYETTPFHLSIEKLKRKFEKCLSAEKVATLHKIEKVFSLGSTQQKNHCHFLKDILHFALEEKVCDIKYQKNNAIHQHTIQFFNISAAYGQWYATGCHVETGHTHVFRCDKVLDVKENFVYPSRPVADFIKSPAILYKNPGATDFEVMVSKKGADIFQKEHYPSMTLCLNDETFTIRGFYNIGEENFIAAYFLGYGDTILSIQPAPLKKLILDKLNVYTTYLSNL
ncbi:helix-turn-helix transcriptional regulator [Anoxynatronum buryatiense]|uniref:Predicted DNA-binding transcriptional regulator YafY, contains an HTH and WYL domains n=1 Tax=Anoxynatronum buryatiense TaxID=489973 RepID=A0AA45WTT0_9CLOT|nr:WYL domain-containing protein [Anoxynatronum buryatiense]SMP43504.1 Predicted DNA-binding transcriptional regulator YafY, contains an HTH and WYL domains [Anoxynatronum buryatiense]